VTLTGADFQEGATVTFGETAASDVMVMDAMTLTAVSPPGMEGMVAVVVTNPDGQTSEPQTFTYGVLQLGDANGDGFVSLKDAIRILRFVSGEDVEISEVAADVNGIAGVSAGDALRVMRFISGLAEFEHPSSQ
jgi:sulfur carrier protein ThiS